MKKHILLTFLACAFVFVGCKSAGLRCPLEKKCKAKTESPKPIEQDGIMKKRIVALARLKPECVEEYKKYHDNIWPDLVAAYKEAGIAQCNCFLDGVNLIVYVEYGPNATKESLAKLHQNERSIEWQRIMKTFVDTSFESGEYEEVFHLE